MVRLQLNPCICVFSFLGLVIFLQLLSPFNSFRNPWKKQESLNLDKANLNLNSTSINGLNTTVGQLEQHSGSSHPQNVTGTYRGKWIKVEEGNLLYKLKLLSKPNGWIVYSIRKVESNAEDTSVIDIEGDMILRQGQFITDNDIKMSLYGIYIPLTGQLTAILEPSHPINGNLTDEDITQKNADYRKSLRDAATLVSQTENYKIINPDAQNVLRKLDLVKTCQLRFDVRASEMLNSTMNKNSVINFGDYNDGQLEQYIAASEIQFEDSQNQFFGAQDGKGVFMEGKLYSPNCGTVLQVNGTTFDLRRYYSKVLRYTTMVSAVSLLQIFLLTRQMSSTGTPAGLASVSMLCMGQQALIDAYLCLVHFTAGILIEQLFNAFSVAALFEFVIFAIFELRYLLMIWKARRGAAADSWQLRNELSLLYARFYGALLGGVVLSYGLEKYQHWMLFGLYSFWIPQIVYSAYNDLRQPLQPVYVLGMTFSRLVLPMYVYACPYGISKSANVGLTFPIILLVYCWIQAGVLMLQWRYGSRCFVPKRFLPPKYDYYRQVQLQNNNSGETDGVNQEMDEEMGYGSVECVICFNPVALNPRSQRMVTPCNHIFHPQCLQTWMNVKMECPTCRHQLPPM